MESTENKAQSLLEIWNSDKGEDRTWGTYYPERAKLERQLANLLESEIEDSCCYWSGGKEKAEEVLAEYRSNFDWDTQYELEISWELVSQYATQSLELSLKELKDYLNGERELEQPNLSEFEGCFEGGYELTGDHEKTVSAIISNFRPKRKGQYCVALMIESEEEVASIANHLATVMETSTIIQKLEVVSITPHN